jgi:hypothetical protein
MTTDVRPFPALAVHTAAVELVLTGGPWPAGQIVVDRTAQTGTILVEYKPAGAAQWRQFYTPNHTAASTITLGTEAELIWSGINVAQLKFTPATVSAEVPVLVEGHRL